MLFLKINPGLGNQLFRYAAVRSLAERRKLGFCYADGKKLVSRYFTLGRRPFYENPFLRIAWYVRGLFYKKKSFVLPWASYNSSCHYEEHDPAFYEVGDWTEMRGWYQSEDYFKDNRESVLEWFTPRRSISRKIRKIEKGFNAPPERRCSVHVRRSDFKIADQGFAHGDQGWMLPASYYVKALKEVPSDIFYVFISDDPDFVEETFAYIKNKYVSRGNLPVVDMFLMTRSRYNIISNSTLAWWGAWLNQIPNKVVIAPKYFIGWSKKLWFPRGIFVKEWNFIDVS